MEAAGLHAGYGAAAVLRGVDLAVRPGQCVALMGRNGMGKTTLLRTLMGLVPVAAGRVLIDGRDAGRQAAFQRARSGIAMVPEGRGVFGRLSVRENLLLAARPGPWTLDRVLATFPRLAQRIHHGGDRLSGGEQQMLAIGRALMTSPRLLVLDEATEGLAPLVREEIWRTLRTIAATGMATLVVDRTVDAVLSLADQAVVLVKGQVAFAGAPATLRADPASIARYLGV